MFSVLVIILIMYALIRFAGGEGKVYENDPIIKENVIKDDSITQKFDIEKYDYDKNFKTDMTEIKK